MEKFLRDSTEIPLDDLYPDPNNPRLGLDETPGYEDPNSLYSSETRDRILGELGNRAFAVEELVETIIGQGWMPIDNILVWRHPAEERRHVVVEGNRRRLALERIRSHELPKARRKLERLRQKEATYSAQTIREQKERVQRLEKIEADTKVLVVLPIDADTVNDLRRKLPRIHAVRHITGAKEWGNFAQDLWLLHRYTHLHEDKFGSNRDIAWDADLMRRVAEEASLSITMAKRQLKASSWYSHFRATWEDELPEGEEFAPSDYYLFENIAKLPWARSQFSVDDSATRVPPEGEQVIFDWVFKFPRPKRADDNPNVFFRHENVLLWDKMRRYDDADGTNFAGRFDPQNHTDAPRMHEVEAEWLSHKARRKPHDIVSELLRRLKEISAETLATEGEFLRKALEELAQISMRYLKMIKAAETNQE
jgi:hypothetical protein